MSDARPLVHLPGTRLTPEVVLHRTLNKIERIKAVAVVVQWDDGTFDLDWSQQRVSELIMATVMAHEQAIEVGRGQHPDMIVSTDKPGEAS